MATYISTVFVILLIYSLWVKIVKKEFWQRGKTDKNLAISLAFSFIFITFAPRKHY